jgi:hypothetical protein
MVRAAGSKDFDLHQIKTNQAKHANNFDPRRKNKENFS